VFCKILKLPEPTLTFKGEGCKDFLEKHDNSLDLLPKFLENLTAIAEDITRLQVNLFKNSFREISRLFTRVTGQENIASISHMIIYILYFTVKEHAIFDWGNLISIEISSQLSQNKKDKKLIMSSYLVFVITHCCQFPKLFICKKVNCEFDLVTFWY
jgi:phosphotransferase system IIB component